MYGFIYITTNNINNKKYIGQRKFSPRWESYLGSGIAFKKALEKYGRENFSREIITYADSKEELNELEIYYIKKHNAVEDTNYYNLIYGGGTTAGYKFSEEAKKNQSDRMKGKNNTFYGKFHSDETKDKISKKNSGRCPSNETREKMGDARRGEANPNYGVTGENHYLYGTHRSEDIKKRIKENMPHKKAVAIVDNYDDMNVLYAFDSKKEATRWIVETTEYGGQSRSMISAITRAIKAKGTVYGFKWINIKY